METQECVREIVRLIDFHNTGAGLTEPPHPKSRHLTDFRP